MRREQIDRLLQQLAEASTHRNDTVFTASKSLSKKVQEIQQNLAKLIIAGAAKELRFEDGRLTFDTRNIASLNSLLRVVAKDYGVWMQDVVKGVIASLNDIAKSSDRYFRLMNKNTPRYAVRAKNLINKRIGLDGTKPVRGGYVISAITGTEPLNAIKTEALKSIARGASQREFMSGLTTKITGGNGLGVIESHHVQTEVSDLFDRYERSYSDSMAKEIGLASARYSGGLMSTTRPFCAERQGKIFTRKEIEGWKRLSFQGKPKVYDPFTDLGGYNCRHTLDWVTDELAKEWE